MVKQDVNSLTEDEASIFSKSFYDYVELLSPLFCKNMYSQFYVKFYNYHYEGGNWKLDNPLNGIQNPIP